MSRQYVIPAISFNKPHERANVATQRQTGVEREWERFNQLYTSLRVKTFYSCKLHEKWWCDSLIKLKGFLLRSFRSALKAVMVRRPSELYKTERKRWEKRHVTWCQREKEENTVAALRKETVCQTSTGTQVLKKTRVSVVCNNNIYIRAK